MIGDGIIVVGDVPAFIMWMSSCGWKEWNSLEIVFFCENCYFRIERNTQVDALVLAASHPKFHHHNYYCHQQLQTNQNFSYSPTNHPNPPIYLPSGVVLHLATVATPIQRQQQ